MKSLLLSVAAAATVATLSGCAAYADPYGGGYAYGPGYVQPSVSIGVGAGYYGNGYYNCYYGGRPYGDRDRDGVANRFDRDRDNDGVRNSRDVRPYNPYVR